MEPNISTNDSSDGKEFVEKDQAVLHRRTLKTLLGFSSNIALRSGEGTAIRRLGKAELGPHAFEERMPTRIRMQLERGSTKNEEGSTGIIKILARLCDQDRSVEAVYLCNPAIQRISKTNKEGNLCGYRNIQMIITYIIGAGAQGSEHFPNGLPSVLDLQDLIEEAWDKGINSQGRVETGGLKGTRKYIGTPEAQALFCGLGIGCRAGTYHGTEDSSSAWELLLEFVKQYFISSSPNATMPCKIHQTNLPPIYLQRPQHSLTVVGFEIRMNGTSNILVFDPAFPLSHSFGKALRSPEDGTTLEFKSRQVRNLLNPFRRGKRQLKRYNDFETLILTGFTPGC